MRLNSLDVYLIQFLHEELTVLGIHDCLNRSAKHLNVILLKYAGLI